MARKMNPEERAAFEEQQARFAEERREFAALYERLRARWAEEDARRERRRRLLRGLVPFLR
jgi:hypothetical protein